MTVDIWIRDYNPPRCFQKKISGRGKHNEHITLPEQMTSSAHFRKNLGVDGKTFEEMLFIFII
jgi:hypothetical protein